MPLDENLCMQRLIGLAAHGSVTEEGFIFLEEFFGCIPALIEIESKRLKTWYLRNYKQIQAQAVSFRSIESVEAHCKGMSCLVLMRQKDGDNLFRHVAEVLDPIDRHPRKKANGETQTPHTMQSTSLAPLSLRDM